jgi:hypothetical protein
MREKHIRTRVAELQEEQLAIHQQATAAAAAKKQRLKPLREAASFPWKQPSRLFVLLQIEWDV